jgi:hypothetical protein
MLSLKVLLDTESEITIINKHCLAKNTFLVPQKNKERIVIIGIGNSKYVSLENIHIRTKARDNLKKLINVVSFTIKNEIVEIEQEKFDIILQSNISVNILRHPAE